MIRNVHRRYDGVFYWSRDAHDYPAWPRPVTTDAEGRFTVRGVGQKLHAELTVQHPGFALQTIDVDTDDNAESKTLSALAPSQILNVRVTYADTGEPVPHSPLRVLASQGRVAKVDESETGDTGQARINSWPADRTYNITAYPPEGQPYLIARGRVDWPKGRSADSSTSPCRGASWSTARSPRRAPESPSRGPGSTLSRRGPGGQGVLMSARTNSDGSFRLGAEPKPGLLFVRGSDDDYVFQAIGSRVVWEGQPGRRENLLACLHLARPETGHGQSRSESGPSPRRSR